MSCFIHFIPTLLFVLIFVGGGVYFTYTGAADAFYRVSPLAAIMPAIILGWILHKGTNAERMSAFLDGVRHRNIIAMCIIFLLAGALSEVTKSIGCVESTVNLALSLIPQQFLLMSLFLIAVFISTAIGTSMGTIATIAPIAIGLSSQIDISPALIAATVVGGAMFGDDLSVISDTTIASVMSQEADMKAKLKFNAKIAIIAASITLIVLYCSTSKSGDVVAGDYTLLLVTPYIVLISLSLLGINVFVSLVLSIIFAGIIGFISSDNYSLLFLSKSITTGFAAMYDIMVLSLMVGGLSGLADRGSQELSNYLSAWMLKRNGGQKMAQLFIAKIVSIFDILLANNTIAIILSGDIVREIAKKHHIPPHHSATWLQAFSCVFQGIIPYGAQILLASAIAKVSPLEVVPHVYYCYILGIVAVLHIMLVKVKK